MKWIEFSGADHIISYELSLHHCLNGKEVKNIYRFKIHIYRERFKIHTHI